MSTTISCCLWNHRVNTRGKALFLSEAKIRLSEELDKLTEQPLLGPSKFLAVGVKLILDVRFKNGTASQINQLVKSGNINRELDTFIDSVSRRLLDFSMIKDITFVMIAQKENRKYSLHHFKLGLIHDRVHFSEGGYIPEAKPGTHGNFASSFKVIQVATQKHIDSKGNLISNEPTSNKN